MVGPIEKVIMGLNQVTRQPCGFAFVIYFSHKAAQSAASYITGTKLDSRYIRVDIDWGFQAGREFGRGKSGGQVRRLTHSASVVCCTGSLLLVDRSARWQADGTCIVCRSAMSSGRSMMRDGGVIP